MNISIDLMAIKQKIFSILMIPIKFWFGLPSYVHIIAFILLVGFACVIGYAIYINRRDIFNIP